MLKAIVIDAKDNLGNLVGSGKKGEEVECLLDGKVIQKVKLLNDIPFNHKFALKPIKKGELALKYSYSIGKATRDIAVGEYVHVHNIESARGRGDLAKSN